MDDGKLLFRQPADGSGALVFGDYEDGGGIAPVSVGLDADFGGLGGSIGVALVVRASVDADFGGLGGDIGVLWDSGVVRGWRGDMQATWQEAKPAANGLQSAWQESKQLQQGIESHWQLSSQAQQAVATHWQETKRLQAAIQSHYQLAQERGNAQQHHWQEEKPLRAHIQARYQLAHALATEQRHHWQEQLRLSNAVEQAWQQAVPRHHSNKAVWFEARPVSAHQVHHWQEATWPRAGITVRPEPPKKPPCYDPETVGLLIFEETWTDDGQLVFVCHRAGPDIPGATVVVPSRKTYIMINSVEIRRADDLTSDPLPSEAFSMNLDKQSWTWTFSATFHPSVMDAVTPGPNGEPVELEVRVNGQPFRLQAERWSKSARFPEHLIKVTGRGKACVLDAPHTPEQSFGNAQARTAQQLMLDVLTINGVGMGWTVDFKLTDWIVPGNEWSHQGTYITALAEIAAAAGGYLQPHDTEATIRVLPSWPKPWWEWDSLTPDISLPEGMGEVEDAEWVNEPLYNRIILDGGAGGITADFTRSGTNGGILKPMVVHPLITGMEVARQRAIAELANSGRMVTKTLTMPVLPDTGVIRPGEVLDFRDEHQVHRIGIVRSTAINWSFPVLTQALQVQCHG